MFDPLLKFETLILGSTDYCSINAHKAFNLRFSWPSPGYNRFDRFDDPAPKIEPNGVASAIQQG